MTGATKVDIVLIASARKLLANDESNGRAGDATRAILPRPFRYRLSGITIFADARFQNLWRKHANDRSRTAGASFLGSLTILAAGRSPGCNHELFVDRRSQDQTLRYYDNDSATETTSERRQIRIGMPLWDAPGHRYSDRSASAAIKRISVARGVGGVHTIWQSRSWSTPRYAGPTRRSRRHMRRRCEVEACLVRSGRFDVINDRHCRYVSFIWNFTCAPNQPLHPMHGISPEEFVNTLQPSIARDSRRSAAHASGTLDQPPGIELLNILA